MRVLAFGAHPDDVEIQCSGTLAKYKAQGHAVGIAIATRGDVGSPTLSREEIAAVREKEARKSAGILGAEFYWLGYDDEFLYDSPDVRRHFIDVIRQFAPDLILCPDKDYDYHPDHTRTGQIIWDTRVMATIPNIPTQHPRVHKGHDIWYYDTAAGINMVPEFYVDISDYWETKAKMIACHESQNVWMMAQYGQDLTDFGDLQSRFRGFQAGCRYAEVFRRSRAFPQGTPKGALLPSPANMA